MVRFLGSQCATRGDLETQDLNHVETLLKDRAAAAKQLLDQQLSALQQRLIDLQKQATSAAVPINQDLADVSSAQQQLAAIIAKPNTTKAKEEQP